MARAATLFAGLARGLGWVAAWLLALGCSAWAFGALSFDFPILSTVVAGTYALAIAAAIFFVRGVWWKLGATFLGFAVVPGWWSTLSPSNDRDWQPDVERLAWAEVKGDEVTLHNFRHCDYRTESDYTPHWETRTVRLSQITGIDLAIDYWGSPWMAHPMVSFQFTDAPPVVMSIEARKMAGESYSAIGGLYRQFDLIYLAADERDIFRLRTNYRKGEDVYLYRLDLTPARARERFLEYVHAMNKLRRHPRWYNAITTNCTTSIRTQHPPAERIPWDWRMLVNGKMDEMLYEDGYLTTDGLSFAELKRRALINPAARAAGLSPDFSALIRRDRPGFPARAQRTLNGPKVP